jgi:hypothetical protein
MSACLVPSSAGLGAVGSRRHWVSSEGRAVLCSHGLDGLGLRVHRWSGCRGPSGGRNGWWKWGAACLVPGCCVHVRFGLFEFVVFCLRPFGAFRLFRGGAVLASWPRGLVRLVLMMGVARPPCAGLWLPDFECALSLVWVWGRLVPSSWGAGELRAVWSRAPSP